MSIPFPQQQPNPLAALLGGGFPPGVVAPLPQINPQQGFGAPMGLQNPIAAGIGGPQAAGDPMGGMLAGLTNTPTMQFILQEIQAQQGLSQPPTLPDNQSQARAQARRKKKRKITEEQIDDKVTRITGKWIPRDNRMDEDLSLYRLEEQVEGSGEVIQKNTPYVVVEKAANMLASQTPTIQVIPPTPDDKENAQKIENFLRWSWTKWNRTWRRSQLQGSLQHAMAHFLCLRGWASFRIWYDSEIDPALDLPIRVKLFDPRQVYPEFGDSGLLYVVHKYWTTYGELKDEWEEAAKEFDEEDDEEAVEVTEYYDDWFHAISVDGAYIKKPTAHEYGFVPWVIVTGNGSPVRATSVDQTSWVEDVGVPIFHGIKSSYASLNRLLSQLATQVANAANPASLYYYDPNQDKLPQPLDYTAGTTNWLLYDRERVEPLLLNPNPNDVGPVIDSLIDDIQKGTLPNVLWGQGGTETGFLMSMMTDAARDQLYSVVEAMQEAYVQINEYGLILIRDFVEGEIGFWTRDQQGVVQSGVTLAPEEVDAVGVENLVYYRDVSPKDRATMAQLAAMLVDKKLISLETAREDYLMIDNTERENQRVLYDLINMDEDIIKKGLVPLTLYQTDPQLFELYMTMKMAEFAGGQPQQMQQPGMPQVPGLTTTSQAPVMQPGADLMQQSLGSSMGGPGGGLPQGQPGAGALPLGMAAGMPLGV